MSLPDQLIQLDKHLFFLINRQWSNMLFDSILPYARESIVWVPLYLFMLVFAVFNFGLRGLLWFAAAGLTVAVSDIVSSHIIKEHIWRLRPCRNPDVLQTIIFRLKYCPQSSSFTSSHATNHFAIAVFIFFTLKQHVGKLWPSLFLLWAAIISYAQVYVGVHFPFDVFSGAVIGLLIGYISSFFFNKNYSLVQG